MECEVASGSYTACSNENMILADPLGTVIHTLDGGKLFVGSFLLLPLFVCTVSIQLHSMQFTTESVVCRLCSSAVNLFI